MKRQEARELVMQLIFQMEAQCDYSEEAKQKFLSEYAQEEDQLKYINKTLDAFIENKTEIDNIIENASVKWHVERMAKVDLAVLRLAVTEINFLNEEDVPAKVAVNEAVNLAKKFGSEDSGKFVNGILGKIITK